MRTTLDIDVEVLRAAKDLARRRHTTAGAIISELARRGLMVATPATEPVGEPRAFFGFQPLPADGRTVSDETVERLREQEGL